MHISVILCTYNREQYLSKALESIAASVLPEDVIWEVLVVDNNSTDRTREIAQDFAVRFSDRFRYIYEPQQGKSYALNSGIHGSKGGILAFVDDDVEVEPTWLWNLTRSLRGNDWAGTGGRTLLADKISPPSWLVLSGPHSLGGVLAAAFDLGDEPSQLDKAPFGANMAYRREMFDKYGLFRTDMGPSADVKIPRPNEDTEFGRRVMAGGERIRYEPSAVVYHPVFHERIRKDYFLRWWFDFGRASIREVGRRPDILGIQRRYWSIGKICLCLLPLNTLRWVLSINPAKRFFKKCMVRMLFGQIVEIHRLWGPAKVLDKASSDEMKVACRVK